MLYISTRIIAKYSKLERRVESSGGVFYKLDVYKDSEWVETLEKGGEVVRY